jgi:hypothetical protein
MSIPKVLRTHECAPTSDSQTRPLASVLLGRTISSYNKFSVDKLCVCWTMNGITFQCHLTHDVKTIYVAKQVANKRETYPDGMCARVFYFYFILG